MIRTSSFLQNLPTLTATAACQPLQAGERAWSVDSEGHLWLARPANGGTELRVLDAWALRPEQRYNTLFGTIDALQAESGTVASAISAGGLWSFVDGNRISITAPFIPSSSASTCGSIGRDAFVLSDGQLYERRSETWFQWQGLDQALVSPSRLLDRDGACRGTGDSLLIASGNRTVWSLTPSAITQTRAHRADLSAVRAQEVLFARDGLLYREPADWKSYSFDLGLVRTLSAAGRLRWLIAGQELVRVAGQTVERASVQLPSPEQAQLHAFASGGVWAVTPAQVCAVVPPRMLRVSGVRMGQASTEDRFRLRARTNDSATNIAARLNGAELAPVRTENDWLVFESPIEVGWNRIDLSTSPERVTRTIEIKREPIVQRSWQTDIQPIYQAHCSDSACHVADSAANAPDLSSFMAWVARAESIRIRVVETQDMPPLASRGPTWGEEAITTIREWLAGGLRP